MDAEDVEVDETENEGEASTGPRVGFHVSAWGNAHLLAAMSSIAHSGFHGAEIFADVSYVYEGRPDEFVELLALTGVKLAGLHSGGTLTDPDYHEAEFAEWVRLLRWVRDAGGEFAVYYGGDPTEDKEADLEHSARLLNQIGAVARDHGVSFCYEPVAHGPFATRESVAALMGATDKDLVGLSVDTAHMHEMGVDPVMFAITQRSRLRIVHIRDIELDVDVTRRNVDRYVEPGEGQLDLVGVAEALRAIGYDGWFIGVVDNPRKNPGACAERSAAYFRDFLQLPF